MNDNRKTSIWGRWFAWRATTAWLGAKILILHSNANGYMPALVHVFPGSR
ncbi:hypothetical protein ZHAS_00008867 [Anopheles sinensis]|uniref:Uncharacterized protein n=1 Tax=Anopheles sinensis TaxID=74873 RepID=A0A084VTI1_ANOSI|nr:hypothetical protein ZHAS_00008867 [Anopheles sinensis]